MPDLLEDHKAFAETRGNTPKDTSVFVESKVLSQQSHRFCVLFVTLGVDERHDALYLMVERLPFENEVLMQR